MNTNAHNNTHRLQWEAPVLYKEEWMNTLNGEPGPVESEIEDGAFPPSS